MEAQDFSGTWVMAYVKAKQPVFTMIRQNGELSLEDETPEDSTIIQSHGLMLLQALTDDKARSYSWDGEENWEIEYLDKGLRLKGSVDSLYGDFDAEGRLVLSSTLDDVPTQYFFEPLNFPGKAQPLEIVNTQWTVDADAGLLSNQLLSFQADSVLTNEHEGRAAFGEYYIHPLGQQTALEFVINLPDNYMGIIYFTRIRKRKMEGIFYEIVDDNQKPVRLPITLRRN